MILIQDNTNILSDQMAQQYARMRPHLGILLFIFKLDNLLVRAHNPNTLFCLQFIYFSMPVPTFIAINVF